MENGVDVGNFSNEEEENIKNYKGIHFKNNENFSYHEHGAHFSFIEICKKLKKILIDEKSKSFLQIYNLIFKVKSINLKLRIFLNFLIKIKKKKMEICLKIILIMGKFQI